MLQHTSLRPVQTGNVWRPNIIKHCLVTKHADVEVSGQTVKTCLIKHRIKLLTQRTMGHKLTCVTFSARDFNMAGRETAGCDSKVQIKEEYSGYNPS